MARSKWSQEEVDECDRAHEARMAELQYPEDVLRELRRARTKWLEQVPRLPLQTSEPPNDRQ